MNFLQFPHFFRLISLTSCLFFLIPLINAQLPSFVPEQSLLAWWSFEQSGLDESPNGNNLSKSNIDFQYDASGYPQSSAFFKGLSTSFMSLNHSNDFNFGFSKDFSIAMWIKTVNNSANGPKSGIVTKWNENQHTTSYPFRIASTDLGNGLSEIVWENFHSSSGVQNSLITTVDNNRYVHLAFIVKDNVLYLYKNGILENTMAFANVDYRNNESIFIGKRNIVSNRNFKGNIDELGVWNRALSSCEVISIYRRSTINTITEQIEQEGAALVYYGNIGYQDNISWYKCFDDETLLMANENHTSLYPGESGYYSLGINIGNTDCVLYSECIFFDNLMDSKTISNQSPAIAVYPNPATTKVKIAIDNIQIEVTEAKLLSSNGSVVQSFFLSKGINYLDVEAYSNGSYVLVVPEFGYSYKLLLHK